MPEITKRGLVFVDDDGTLSLIRMDEEMTVHGLTIGCEEFYQDWPETHADLVDVDTIGDDLGLVNLTSIQAMSFNKDGQLCVAREAIRYALDHEPEKIYQLLQYESQAES